MRFHRERFCDFAERDFAISQRKVARASRLRLGIWRGRLAFARRRGRRRHTNAAGTSDGGTRTGLPLIGFLTASVRSAVERRRRLDDKRSGLFCRKKWSIFVDFSKCCSLLYINNLSYFTERDFAISEREILRFHREIFYDFAERDFAFYRERCGGGTPPLHPTAGTPPAHQRRWHTRRRGRRRYIRRRGRRCYNRRDTINGGTPSLL